MLFLSPLLLFGPALASAHAIVSQLTVGTTTYAGWNPVTGPLSRQQPNLFPASKPEVVWGFAPTSPDQSYAPVKDLSSADLACNRNASKFPPRASAPIAAGESVTFFWTQWLEGHSGPVITYLALCSGDCAKADLAKLDFFKINEAGLGADGKWATDSLRSANSSWTVALPKNLKPGAYVIRHEIFALHFADKEGGAESYAMCADLDVRGEGTALPGQDLTVRFPGAYKKDDKGILVNIWFGLRSYVIPGPSVWKGAA